MRYRIELCEQCGMPIKRTYECPFCGAMLCKECYDNYHPCLEKEDRGEDERDEYELGE